MEEIHQTKILKKLDSGPLSIEQLNKKLGGDIRNALNVLLANKQIIPCGYVNQPNNFACKYIKVRKTSEIFNQIHIKHLIENSHIESNFNELYIIFEKRLEMVNEAYQRDVNILSFNLDKMLLDDAIRSIENKEFYKNTSKIPENNKIFTDKLQEYKNKYPDGQIWYLKKYNVKNLELKKIILIPGGPPYFTVRPYIDKRGDMTFDEFILFFYRTLIYYLPVHAIDYVFDKLIKYALSIQEDREEYQWELAEMISEDGSIREFAVFLNNFIEKIENEAHIPSKYTKDTYL
ncbi:MAG TPA: hypothetical protein PLC38_03895 [Methanobacterium sp.]|nr:MAG: hypothetical protein FGO69_10150 [Methanobacterium sp.]HOI71410.1 hypothetical protein [Methanobacterium sp.]